MADLEAVYKRCCPLLLFIVRKFDLAPEVGDEIVQEAFLRLAHQSEIPYSDGDACQRFLIVTTRHLAIDERRKRRPMPVADLGAITDQNPSSLGSGSLGSGSLGSGSLGSGSLGSGTIGEGRLSRVAEVWEQLKPLQDFPLFQDYYQLGWTTAEIAERRQLPAGTVRSKIHRLRERFRRKFRERLDLDCN